MCSWTNRSGGEPTRSPALRSVSPASLAASWPNPESMAAVSSPSSGARIARLRSRSTLAGSWARSHPSAVSVREAAPISSTRDSSVFSGLTLAEISWPASWCRSSGFPWVSWWAASATSVSTAALMADFSRSPVQLWQSGAGRSSRAYGRAVMSRMMSWPRRDCESAVRIITMGSESSRLAMYEHHWADWASAWSASSMAMISGWVPVMERVARYRLCSRSGATRAPWPSYMCPSGPGEGSAGGGPGRGSKSWRTTPKGKSCSAGWPRAVRTAPACDISASAAWSRVVFPMPLGPRMTRTEGFPAYAAESASCITRNSMSRCSTCCPDNIHPPRARVLTCTPRIMPRMTTPLSIPNVPPK